MRDYGKVHTSFWTSQTTRTMSEDARAMAMYLLTCPHGTISGAFRLPDGYVCDDLQWTPERVKSTLIELLDNGFANRCETTKWVWIHKHFEWNKPENPNQFKSAKKIAESIPDECSWKPEYMRINAFFLGIEYQPFINPSETLPEPVAETVTVSVSVTGDKNIPDAKAPVDEELLNAGRATWKSYCEAYAKRYAVEPVQNKTVRSQMKQFVQRIGFDESPLVAAFYVGHNDPFYVKKCHSVGQMLSDAEKLRTEWATGRNSTNQDQFKSSGQRRLENTDKAVKEFLGEQPDTANVIDGEYSHA